MTQDTSDDTTAGTAREDETDPKTLGEMNHTNPFTNEAFGATQTYDRGRTIAADGGETEADADESDADADEETAADGGSEPEPGSEELRDIEHTPPGDAEGTNGVYERGNEGREENT
jgi:hypothetical protein